MAHFVVFGLELVDHAEDVAHAGDFAVGGGDGGGGFGFGGGGDGGGGLGVELGDGDLSLAGWWVGFGGRRGWKEKEERGLGYGVGGVLCVCV